MSRRSLREMTHGQQAVVETDKTDRYGGPSARSLFTAKTSTSSSCGAGWRGITRSKSASRCRPDRMAYAKDEDAAKALQNGLWAMPKPIPPWEFRRERTRTASGLPVAAQPWSNTVLRRR